MTIFRFINVFQKYQRKAKLICQCNLQSKSPFPFFWAFLPHYIAEQQSIVLVDLSLLLSILVVDLENEFRLEPNIFQRRYTTSNIIIICSVE